MSLRDYSMPVHQGPVGVNASDCTGDAIPDLVVANQESNNITILRNRGDGTFAFWKTISIPTPADDATPAPTPVPGAEPGNVSSAVCGDFTGDKLPDLAITTRSNPGVVTVLGAQASGEFVDLGSTLLNSLSANSIATADLNRDGNLDLIVVNANSNDMSILLGDGTGAFPTETEIPVPGIAHTNRPSSAAVADYDMDGNLDIAVASRGDPPLRLFLGDGHGNFTPFAGPLPAPLSPRSIASADVNRDGIPDLVTIGSQRSSKGPSTVTFYRGTGHGTFDLFAQFSVPGNTPTMALADFNRDGLVDLALDYYKTNDVQVLFATGPAQYTYPARFPVMQSALEADEVSNGSRAAVPRDSPNGTQLVALNGAGRTLQLIELAELDTPPAVTPMVALSNDPRQLVLADMNNDSVPDAVVAAKTHRGAAALQILPGDSQGGYAAPLGLPLTPFCGDGIIDNGELCDDGNLQPKDGCSRICAPEIGRDVTALAAADLDNDGSQDLVVATVPGSVVLLFGDGRGRFARVRRLTKTRIGVPLAVADFTGDDFVDIVTLPAPGRQLALFVNDGTGQFTSVPVPTPFRVGSEILAADFDRNGLTDLALSSKGAAPAATVLYNDGAGPARIVNTVALPRRIRALAAADFDEDGALDLLAASATVGQPSLLYRGSPSGAFAPGEPRLADTSFTSATVVDLNDDLHPDVVLCDSAAAPPSCQVRYGNGAGYLSVSAQPGTTRIGRQMHALATVDMDGDGVLDFVSLSRRDKRAVVVFRSAGSIDTTRVELITGFKPHAVAVGDLNGDGRPDIVVANQASSDLSIFLNQGNRLFATLPRIPLPRRVLENPLPSAVALADVNRDDRLDVIVAQAGTSSISLLLNINDAFAAGGLVDGGRLSTGANPVALLVVDLNHDSRPDFITANSDEDTVSVLLASADGYLDTTLDSYGSTPGALAAADLNADGHPDLVVVNQESNNIATFLNDGLGGLEVRRVALARGRIIPKAVCAADFDNDGFMDIAVASHATQDILVLRGTGDGSWARDERVYQVGSDPVAVSCVDVDGNGWPDIVFGHRRSGRIDFIRNDGSM